MDAIKSYLETLSSEDINKFRTSLSEVCALFFDKDQDMASIKSYVESLPSVDKNTFLTILSKISDNCLTVM